MSMSQDIISDVARRVRENKLSKEDGVSLIVDIFDSLQWDTEEDYTEDFYC